MGCSTVGAAVVTVTSDTLEEVVSSFPDWRLGAIELKFKERVKH